ncbi:MAG TPA: hypothetical protein VF381_08360 [Thermoanaerobaculia bacterium]
MKRSIAEVLRRGFESAYANWQLIALRIAENLVFAFLLVASVIAAVVPLVVSIGLSGFNVDKPDETAATIGAALLEHLAAFLWIFVGALVLAFVLVVLHSFVMAGCAQTFVDAERVGRPFKAFSMERWLSGGKHSTWTVFWIYNITYGTTLIIVLLPAVITIAALLAFRESPRVLILGIGCLGLAVSVFLLIIACVVAAIWSLKAIVMAVERNLSASEATKAAWAEAKADFGRHFAVAFVLFVISFGGAMAISMFSVVFSMPSAHSTYMSLALAPARLVISFVQSVFGAAVGMWMLASFAALSDGRGSA